MENKIKTKPKLEDVLYRFKGNIEPRTIDERAINILAKMDEADEKEKDRLSKKHNFLLDQFVRMHEFEKHFLLAESVNTKFAAMSIKMTQDLIKEYNCTTTLEKSLVEIIVNAFCRSLNLSAQLTTVLSRDSIGIEQGHINLYSFLGKELDRANREYLTALSTLQQIKSPSIKVNLKAETAIVGQNQQFNSLNSNQNENNKAN